MRFSFREKYGFWIGVFLLTIFAWQGLSMGLNRSEATAMLFPLNWLYSLPIIGDFAPALMLPMQYGAWWFYAELLVTILGWLFLFYAMRGAFYACSNLEGPSMWIAFALCILVGFLFLGFILMPVFDQMAVWWGNWPGIRQPQLPGSSQ